jgi:hypothetical protein
VFWLQWSFAKGQFVKLGDSRESLYQKWAFFSLSFLFHFVRAFWKGNPTPFSINRYNMEKRALFARAEDKNEIKEQKLPSLGTINW